MNKNMSSFSYSPPEVTIRRVAIFTCDTYRMDGTKVWIDSNNRNEKRTQIDHKLFLNYQSLNLHI